MCMHPSRRGRRRALHGHTLPTARRRRSGGRILRRIGGVGLPTATTAAAVPRLALRRRDGAGPQPAAARVLRGRSVRGDDGGGDDYDAHVGLAVGLDRPEPRHDAARARGRRAAQEGEHGGQRAEAVQGGEAVGTGAGEQGARGADGLAGQTVLGAHAELPP